MKRSTVFVASALIVSSVLASTASVRAAKLADLTVAAASPAYGLLATCAPGGNAIVFHVVVSNIGDAPSPLINSVQAVWVQDSKNPAWAGGAKLPAAIAPKGSATVDVFVPAISPPAPMWGPHVFDVTVDGPKLIAEKSYANNSTTIAVSVPRGFCLPPMSPASPSTTVTPKPTPKPVSVFNPAIVHAGNTLVATNLPPPINLAQALTKDVCQAHGGSAGSFACYIGLPAGKVALVWDYPYSNPVDGYNVYRADSTTSSGPTSVQMVTIPKPIAQATQSDWHFAILDKQSAGSCFAVTAYHGNAESNRSVQYCIAENGVPKMVSLDPDRVGTMIADAYVRTDMSLLENEDRNKNILIRGYVDLSVGHTHTADLWRDQAHTQVSEYANSVYRGYAHFNTWMLAGRHIAQAQLSLLGGTTQGSSLLCLVNYGQADHFWNSGDRLYPNQDLGNGPYQGPDLHLDVTRLVQSWADGSAQNTGFALVDDQSLGLPMVVISDTCLTNFPTAKLDVTYY